VESYIVLVFFLNKKLILKKEKKSIQILKQKGDNVQKRRQISS